MTQIEFVGSGLVSVEDCAGVEITEYDEATVKITSPHIVLRLFGNGLTLKKLMPGCVTVTGKISSMEFEGGRPGK